MTEPTWGQQCNEVSSELVRGVGPRGDTHRVEGRSRGILEKVE